MFRNITPIVQNLLLANVVLFLVSAFIFPQLSEWFALYYIHSPYFKPFQFLTYMFMHADFWHLFSNMFGLLIFGPLLEQFLGPKKLLTLWMVCGIGSGILYSGYTAYRMNDLETKVAVFQNNPDPETFNKLVVENRGFFQRTVFDFVDDYSRNPDDPQKISQAKQTLDAIVDIQGNVPMVGASGALFGILIAFAMLFPNTQLFLLFPPMPIKAKYLVLFYGLYTIYNVLVNNPLDNVAHFAHLSGLLIGGVLVYRWKKDRNSFY
ncbi:rhomboid family intramembrane serine protease [Algoriphagus halophytocola]|uniref:Rhomboid family intramembrane serine protease n=1 Tax=Algoriphagus halophytocola TaxID=2991499 RepID=A0ABY6MC94_9BACT|nr:MULTISPECIES: rhomboid family intramembrane serine protease [unclassified Algoriphagus]UZD21297.1 rhomboid family intramembrane serine protease [Algoriphagus sp. TR-M5]WBL42508.1 rhomboid family intramembrane serine protease [Algoriphagus sp. TR-M9]